MRPDFCVFILTHGRADNVKTVETLARCGYTGKVFIVIDDEDQQEARYRARYGDQVLQFSKQALSSTFDEGDNFDDRRTITYARNACWALAAQVGCRYFMQLDDDYTGFEYRFNGLGHYGYWPCTTLDRALTVLVDFYEATPCLAVALAQGGDYIGGPRPTAHRRKAMNSFLCSIDRPFLFRGRMNEDVNTYTYLGRQGALFLTVMQLKLVQTTTQASSGGISDLYARVGTHTKSFYTVMYSPSCVKIGRMGDRHDRVHHVINWHRTTPKILREEHRRSAPE